MKADGYALTGGCEERFSIGGGLSVGFLALSPFAVSLSVDNHLFRELRKNNNQIIEQNMINR